MADILYTYKNQGLREYYKPLQLQLHLLYPKPPGQRR